MPATYRSPHPVGAYYLAAGVELGAGWCGRASLDARAGRSPRPGRPHPMACATSAPLVGYAAECSTDQQDHTAQRDCLLALGVATGWIHAKHGLTGTNHELTTRQISLSLGGSVYDHTMPSDDCCSTSWRWSLSSNPTSSGFARSRYEGGEGQGPTARQTAQVQSELEAHLASPVHSGEYNTGEVVELFGDADVRLTLGR